MHVRLCREIAPLEEVWLKLQSEGACHVFQTFGWITDWMETVGRAQDIQPFIVTVNLGESPCAIIPLCVRRVFGVRILTMMGGFHADYAGAVVGKDFCAGGLWDEIAILARKEDVDLIWVRNIPEKIEDMPNPLFAESCLLNDAAHAVSIDGSWLDFYDSRVKPRIRADSRRQLKRLSQIGELKFMIAQDGNERNFLTEVMIEQKRARYRAMEVKDQFVDSVNREFYLRRNKATIGPRPHVSALKLDDRILAVHWGEIHHGRYYYLMPSHHPEWEKYSPGRLLLENLLQWCFAEGLKIFDFTGGGEAYKLEWASVEVQLFKYELSLTLKGKLFMMASDYYRKHGRRILSSLGKIWKR